MAFNSEAPRVEYTASAGQTIFTFLFKIYAKTDLVVYQTPVGQDPDDLADVLVVDTDYTVIINGDSGGTATLTTPATSGDAITLLRELPATRDVDYQTNGDFLADTIDEDQNYQTYLIADQQSANNRAMVLATSAQGVSNKMPSVSGDSYLRWKTDETGLENDTTIPQSVTDAAASAAAAQASEDSALASEEAAALSEGNAAISATEAAEAAASVESENIIHVIGSGTGDPEGYTKAQSDSKPIGKSLFTNGTLLSRQEGMPTGITTAGKYFADVFLTYATSGATLDTSQQKTDGNAEAVRITASVASTNLTSNNAVFGFNDRQFELQNFAHLKDQDITLQFKFKASQTGNYPIAIRDSIGAESYVTTFNYMTADTEQLVTFTINLDSTRLDFTVADNANLFDLYIGVDNNGTYELADASKDTWQTGIYMTTDACVNWSSTLNAYIQIGDIQIDKGIVAKEIKRIGVRENLADCQRYLPAVSGMNVVFGAAQNSISFRGSVDFKTTARVAPTGITVSALSDYLISDFSMSPSIPSSIVLLDTCTNSAELNATGAGLTTQRPTQLRGQSVDAKILFTGCRL